MDSVSLANLLDFPFEFPGLIVNSKGTEINVHGIDLRFFSWNDALDVPVMGVGFEVEASDTFGDFVEQMVPCTTHPSVLPITIHAGPFLMDQGLLQDWWFAFHPGHPVMGWVRAAGDVTRVSHTPFVSADPHARMRTFVVRLFDNDLREDDENTGFIGYVREFVVGKGDHHSLRLIMEHPDSFGVCHNWSVEVEVGWGVFTAMLHIHSDVPVHFGHEAGPWPEASRN